MFVGPLNEHFVAMGFDTAMATLTWAFTLANSIGPIPMIIGGYINDNIGPKSVSYTHLNGAEGESSNLITESLRYISNGRHPAAGTAVVDVYKRQMLTFDDCNALELAMTLKDAMGDDVHILSLIHI